MNKIQYRGHYIKKVSKRNSNLKWQVRFPKEDEPRRLRTQADAIACVDRYEEIKASNLEKEVN